MNLHVRKDDLHAAISTVSRATGKVRSELPLDGVLLQSEVSDADTGTIDLTLTGTDIDLTISAFLQAQGSPGIVLLPGSYLASVVQVAGGEWVDLEVNEAGDTVDIRSGRSKWHLRTLPVRNYPKVKHEDHNSLLSAGPFLSAINRVLPAYSRDKTRPALQGIRFENRDGFEIVATDSYRMTVVKLHETVPAFEGITIPGRVLSEIARVKAESDKIGVGIGAGQITFRIDNTLFTSRLIEEAYPPYASLMKSNDAAKRTQKLTVGVAALEDAIKRVTVLATDQYRTVVLSTGQEPSILATASEAGEASEPLDGATYEGPELPLMAFQSQRLLESLEVAQTETVEFYFEGSQKPIVVQAPGDSDFWHILMPVKVKV